MASTQSTPAATCAAVGGHGKFAASVLPLPDVVHPLMGPAGLVTLATVIVHVGVPTAGGPVVPDTTVFIPASFPAEVMLVRARAVQLTGMSLPRKRIWDWAGSALHSSIEANEPAVKFAPLTLTMSPPARPEHTGAVGLESLHVTPAAVEVRLSVCVAAAALLVTLVANNTEPATRVRTPAAESNLEAC